MCGVRVSDMVHSVVYNVYGNFHIVDIVTATYTAYPSPAKKP